MIVKFLKTSTQEEIQPQVEGETLPDISNAYNSFVALQVIDNKAEPEQIFHANGVIIRRFNNDTEIHLIPNFPPLTFN